GAAQREGAAVKQEDLEAGHRAQSYARGQYAVQRERCRGAALYRGSCPRSHRSWSSSAAERPDPCATSSSTAWTAHARISTSSGEPCSISSPLSIRATSPGSKLRIPSRRRTWGTRLSANIVRRSRSPKRATPARCRSAAAICARLRNGMRRPSYVEVSEKHSQPPRRLASATPDPLADWTSAVKLPSCSVDTCRPRSFSD